VLVVLFFAFTILVNNRRIPREEQMLIEKFGDEYREYINRCARVSREDAQD